MSMHWNYRLFEHRGGEETYTTVHEVYYDEGGLSFVATPASPQTKEDLEFIALAFDKPVVGWLDDASRTIDERGFVDYKRYGWFQEQK